MEKDSSSYNSTQNSREFGVEISNMAKNKKEIKYPKPSNSKENVNNIKTYHVNATNINDKLNKKKSKSRKNKDKGKQSKPNKSKINLIIKKINKGDKVKVTSLPHSKYAVIELE